VRGWLCIQTKCARSHCGCWISIDQHIFFRITLGFAGAESTADYHSSAALDGAGNCNAKYTVDNTGMVDGSGSFFPLSSIALQSIYRMAAFCNGIFTLVTASFDLWLQQHSLSPHPSWPVA
jgi:hypothetical protein